MATLPADALLLAGSEGGLFDYGTDAQILSNLRVLHAGSPADAQVCGTLTLSAGPGQLLRQGTVASVIARDLAPFAALLVQAAISRSRAKTPTSLIAPHATANPGRPSARRRRKHPCR